MTRQTRDGVMPQSTARSETRDESWTRQGLFDERGSAPAATTVQDEADARLMQLARAIELEIIPRLMLAHRAANECAELSATTGRSIQSRDVQEFAQLVLSPDDDPVFARVEWLRAQGISIESLYLDLLAPTARELGELWTQDQCDFTQVTIGLGRLQRVLRELSPAFHDVDEAAPIGRRVLLLPCPGEQHTFGLVMVSEFFRRAGWEVSGGSWQFGLDAPNMVADDWYDVVGFSMGAEEHLDALNDCIRAVRQASRNAGVVIMAGGPLFAFGSDLLSRVGADVVSADGKQAPQLAEDFVAHRGSLVG